MTTVIWSTYNILNRQHYVVHYYWTLYMACWCLCTKLEKSSTVNILPDIIGVTPSKPLVMSSVFCVSYQITRSSARRFRNLTSNTLSIKLKKYLNNRYAKNGWIVQILIKHQTLWNESMEWMLPIIFKMEPSWNMKSFVAMATQMYYPRIAVIPSCVTLWYGYVTLLREVSQLFAKQRTIGLFWYNVIDTTVQIQHRKPSWPSFR